MNTRRDLLKFFAAGTIINSVGTDVQAKLTEEPKLVEIANSLPASRPLNLQDVTGFTLLIETKHGVRTMKSEGFVYLPPAYGADEVIGGGSRLRAKIKLEEFSPGRSPSSWDDRGQLMGKGLLL